MSSMTQHRVLGVFAHPDDESIAGGTFLALAAHRGHDVSVITCTRGERGEVVPPAIAHLATDAEALADHREHELSRALAELGAARHLFLDQVPALAADRPRRFVDSGMSWVRPGLAGPAPDASDDAFATLDVEVLATLLAIVVRQLRPDVVITEDPDGGYGHPDHVQAHRVTMRAVALAADREAPLAELAAHRPWQVAAVAWVTQDVDAVRGALDHLTEHLRRTGATHCANGEPLSIIGSDDLPASAVPAAEIDSTVAAAAAVPAVLAALRAHESQLCVVGGLDGPRPLVGYLATSNGVLSPLLDEIAVRTAPGYPAEVVDRMLTTPAGERGAGTDGSGLTDDPGLTRLDVEARGDGPRPGTAPGSPPSDRVLRSPGNGGPAAESRAGRVVTNLLCIVLGLGVGALGTVVHRYQQGPLPTGLVLALLGVLAAGATARALGGGAGLFVMSGATVLTTQAMAFTRPGGDVLVTNEAISYVWLFGVVVACILAALLPRSWFASARRPRSGSTATPDLATPQAVAPAGDGR